jgi:AcrR family transcriptional regulator
MKRQNSSTERDREATEKRLLTTIGQMIEEDGFEKIGINAVAAKSEVSKILIYRYFGSIDGLITTYIRQHDFWINFPNEFPPKEEIPSFLKSIFHKMILQLRSNATLRKLYRWELTSSNSLIEELRKQRESSGTEIIHRISDITGHDSKEIATIATIITSSITYLVILGETCPIYNSIEINHSDGWAQLSHGIDSIIDKAFGIE